MVGVLLLLLLLLPSAAHAQERAASIELDYHAPPSGCPDRLGFFELIRSRAGDVVLEDDGHGGRRFTVSLEKHDAEDLPYRGRLGEPGKSDDVTRTLEGASCDEVARGLALVIAMQLVPRRDAPSPAPSSPARVSPAPPFPAKTAPAERRHPPSPPREPREPHEPHGFEPTLLAGASMGLTSSIGSRAAPTLQASVELRSMSGPWYARPSLRLAALFARAPDMKDREGAVEATLASALLRGCFLTVPGLGPRLAIEPCASFELGRLFSVGRTPKAELSTTTPWTALGGGVHVLGWVRRAVFVESDVILFAPLERYRSFLTRPESPLYETPELGFRWSIGAGVRFL